MAWFFIKAFEIIVKATVILGICLVLILAFITGFSGLIVNGETVSGPIPFFLTLIGGLAYVTFLGGFMFLILEIYKNTKRTTEALEHLANTSDNAIRTSLATEDATSTG